MSIDGITTYYNYSKYILQAGATIEKINNKKNKGWFHFSRAFLLPLIEVIDTLLSDY